jgi:hypothetical protein
MGEMPVGGFVWRRGMPLIDVWRETQIHRDDE